MSTSSIQWVALLAGLVLHPFDRAQETLRFYRDFARSLPDEVNTIGALLTSPEGTSVAAIAVCYNGDLSMGEQVLRPLREFGPPLVDGMRPRVGSEVQTLLDANTQCGRRNYISLFPATRECCQPGASGGHGLQPSRCAVRVGLPVYLA